MSTWSRSVEQWGTWMAAVLGPAIVTAVLVNFSHQVQRDYVFIYLGLVAVVGVVRGLWPALACAVISFLLVDYFFVPPVGTFTIADEQDIVNLIAFLVTAGVVGLLASRRRRTLLESEALTRQLRAPTPGFSPTEYGLLASLARHSGQVIDHRTLLREVWGPSYGDERNYLRTFIQRLRTKLETDAKNPQIIVTAGTRGYRFGPPSTADAHIEH